MRPAPSRHPLGRVSVDGQPVRLTAQEYRLLAYLMHHQGRVVSRTELTEHLYDQDFDRDSNIIEVFVGRLRKKLGVDLIETARGLGYRLRAEPPPGRCGATRSPSVWSRALPSGARSVLSAGGYPGLDPVRQHGRAQFRCPARRAARRPGRGQRDQPRRPAGAAPAARRAALRPAALRLVLADRDPGGRCDARSRSGTSAASAARPRRRRGPSARTSPGPDGQPLRLLVRAITLPDADAPPAATRSPATGARSRPTGGASTACSRWRSACCSSACSGALLVQVRIGLEPLRRIEAALAAIRAGTAAPARGPCPSRSSRSR